MLANATSSASSLTPVSDGFLGKGSPSPVPMQGRAEHPPYHGCRTMGPRRQGCASCGCMCGDATGAQAGEEVRSSGARCCGGLWRELGPLGWHWGSGRVVESCWDVHPAYCNSSTTIQNELLTCSSENGWMTLQANC